MTEAEWLTCQQPQRLFEHLWLLEQGGRQASDRKLLLFATACCREYWHHMTDWRSQRAVETVERRADGHATLGEIEAAHDATASVVGESWQRRKSRYPGQVAWVLTQTRLRAMALASATARTVRQAMGKMAWKQATRQSRQLQRQARLSAWEAEEHRQCDLLRDIFGNPFRSPPALAPAWLAWKDGTIAKLAQAIYEDRAFERLPILADALEEVDCADADVLDHLRSPLIHVRGCWALDWILAKK